MTGVAYEIWTFSQDVQNPSEIDGYTIHATDGEIGKVEQKLPGQRKS